VGVNTSADGASSVSARHSLHIKALGPALHRFDQSTSISLADSARTAASRAGASDGAGDAKRRRAVQPKEPHQMMNTQIIKPDMPVVCSNNQQFAVVDHLEGKETIKLKKDGQGKHHFIPVSWVKSIDDKIHIDRPGDQAMREWRTES
jgi:hypothetical protein